MGAVGAGNAASGDQQTFNAGREKTSVGEVIRLAILDFGFGLTCSGWVMNINYKKGLVHDHVREAAAECKFLSVNYIIAHYSAALADSRSRSAAGYPYIIISRQVLFQKLFQKKHLLSEFEVGLENALDICDVDPIDLGGVDLSLPGNDSRVQPYCG